MELLMSNDPIVNLVNSNPSYLKALELFAEMRNSNKLNKNVCVNHTVNNDTKAE